jgi:exodeoxyribonuclease VII large subunit
LAGLAKAKDTLNSIQMRLRDNSQQLLSFEKSRLIRMETILRSSHPKRVLERGYSMAQTKDGAVLSSVKNITSGQEITMTFADGSAFADITKIIEDDEK